MGKEVVILLAEDDEGHASLIIQNLKRAGITNKFVHFKDGQETLDFLFQRGDGLQRSKEVLYTLLLDIRIPKVDGFEVIDQVKSDRELRKLPIYERLTTVDEMSDEEVKSILEYHRKCLDERQALTL